MGDVCMREVCIERIRIDLKNEKCVLERPSATAVPKDEWLPITQSRNGNWWTSAFLLVSSGIGIQALSLPLAFHSLGWVWGILCLSIAFVWQLYTIGLLVNLHESVSGTRYSRYLHLSLIAFGGKLGKFLAIFPVMYLSGGTCVMLIITGGGTVKHFYQLICGDSSITHPLTTTQCFLIFACLALLVSLFCPNLHSVALVSVFGAIAAVGYCTTLWVVSIQKGRPDGTVYDPSKVGSDRARGVLNALGLIVLAFRGHNVVLEIQGTLPSGPNSPSSKPMWRGVAASYLIIAACFYPLAIGGYWAFGNKIPANGGILTAVSTSLHHAPSKAILSLLYMLVVISCVASFQIYGMVVYDNLERTYASKKNKKCPKLVSLGIRIFFGSLTYFISVAFPFLGSLAMLIGGIALPVTFAYPCFMWIAIHRPSVKSIRWVVNFGLGCLGIGLSLLLVVSGVWNLTSKGLDANFFHPR